MCDELPRHLPMLQKILLKGGTVTAQFVAQFGNRMHRKS
jgi:hypothetical protein